MGHALRIVLGIVLGIGGPIASAARPTPRKARQDVVLPDTSDASRGLDLSAYRLQSVYEADFCQPLKFIHEADLAHDGKRVRKPEGVDWVAEGKPRVRVENGRLVLAPDGEHLVFWSTRVFPANFLLEFDVSPADSNQGLNIVFFAARDLDGGGIFDLDQPLRGGVFKNYHTGSLNCYHTSYWAIDPDGKARGTAHIRRNRGFKLVAAGRDYIAGQGPGPHRVRLLKDGGRIELEVNGKIACRWTDPGPVWQDGFIGLRQMSHTSECRYAGLKVSELVKR